jgi:hypothetical protein
VTASAKPRHGRGGEILHFIFLPGLAGSVAGLVAVAGLLVLNVGSLGTLALGPSGGFVPVALLCAGFVITFGSAAIGATIMALGEPEE